MALTPAQRQQNKRDREHGLPPTYAPEPRIPKELIEERFSQHTRDMQWAVAQDAQDTFYKSECRKCVDLLAIYEGTNILNKEDEDEDEDDPGDECGRWDNGRLGRNCLLAGTEFCDFECPYR